MTATQRRAIGLLLLSSVAGVGCSPETTTSPADAGSPTHDAGTHDGSDQDAGTHDASTDSGDAAVASNTEADLDAFFNAHGGRAAFPPSYVDAVEAMLRAEDEVTAGNYSAVRTRIDEVFTRYPLSDQVWWSGVGLDGTNVGTPVAYYGLRMLDEVARVGLAPPPSKTHDITLTVVLVACADGQRPVDAARTQGETVHLELDQGVVADDHRLIRQSLNLFRQYVGAISEGALRLGVEIEHVDGCIDVGFQEAQPVSGLLDAGQAVSQVDASVANRTDMWWVIYPSNVPSDSIFDETPFITGGMGAWGAAPLFMIDDLWLVRKPPHLGSGLYSEVERRVYLPQWLQHEFFHHLFRTWPNFALEATPHQWFDRSTWPSDFVGAWEPDYYAEALHRRLSTATPSITAALRVAPGSVDLSAVTTADLVGEYERSPVENGWHSVTLVLENNALFWTNAGGARWSLTWMNGELRTQDDCPYGPQIVGVDLEHDSEGTATLPVTGLRFGGELYSRR
ncbi:MAG: hypothetical protein H6718_12140 [Polyangiaceae bacterium]|nr:hypothetical protein [Polyangiaceae bacterium]MCB9606821.1 hypothetical protein [Polyangiaceae bacterium]